MSDIDSEKLLEAMKSEIDSMSSNQVWTLVDRPKGVRSVGCKWVYKRKIRVDREVTTFKARLVAKGYTQRLSSGRDLYGSAGGINGSRRRAEAVGSIQYVVQCTRPDVAYALSVTSRYQACAGEAHWTAVKTILKYLRRTKDVFFVYGGVELILEGSTDASFLSDDNDAKSQSGFVFKLNGGVVAWKSSKQDTAADSSMEAEHIAASEATKEAVWMENYIQELGVVPSIVEPIVIFCDNNGAIAQAKESRSHHRSNIFLDATIYPKRWWEEVTFRWISSVDNTADPLTKAVSEIAHAQHLGKIA
ncbi:UNVERIFIED_CONTAM: Retrovirus-related Pol polyprotein from transposon TNT 1-94 [Sesamum angustifolium]|uniref:Retrovirus-related Pol polyprotein from transposon TNT 1-94 n=1 Tax=Sesamum angustifolium TaxID=2727405 RepID=A0AAW2ILM4_9LAMI